MKLISWSLFSMVMVLTNTAAAFADESPTLAGLAAQFEVDTRLPATVTYEKQEVFCDSTVWRKTAGGQTVTMNGTLRGKSCVRANPRLERGGQFNYPDGMVGEVTNVRQTTAVDASPSAEDPTVSQCVSDATRSFKAAVEQAKTKGSYAGNRLNHITLKISDQREGSPRPDSTDAFRSRDEQNGVIPIVITHDLTTGKDICNHPQGINAWFSLLYTKETNDALLARDKAEDDLEVAIKQLKELNSKVSKLRTLHQESIQVANQKLKENREWKPAQEDTSVPVTALASSSR